MGKYCYLAFLSSISNQIVSTINKDILLAYDNILEFSNILLGLLEKKVEKEVEYNNTLEHIETMLHNTYLDTIYDTSVQYLKEPKTEVIDPQKE